MNNTLSDVALRELQLVIDAIPDALVQAVYTGEVTWVNEAAKQVFPGLKIGTSILEHLNKDKVRDAVVQLKKTGEVETVEFKWTVGLRRYILNVRLVPLVAEDSSKLILFSFQDLTAQRQLDKARADFIAAASHELRTPLTSLLGFVETMQSEAANDPLAREQFLEIMAQQGRRMNRLVDDLLSLSKIEMNESNSPSELVEVGRIISPIVNSLGPQASSRNKQLVVSGVLELKCVADLHQMGQVVANLIENSIKYAHDNTDIKIDVSAVGDYVRIVIKDISDGIPAKYIPRLTERFFRVDKARSRELGGTGLGLAIVKHIIKRHRGRFNITSRLRMGSEFEVLLPRKEIPILPKTVNA